MGSARKGQKEKGFAGQKCFSLGRELRAGGSEIPIIPKLCLHPAGSVGLFPQGWWWTWALPIVGSQYFGLEILPEIKSDLYPMDFLNF